MSSEQKPSDERIREIVQDELNSGTKNVISSIPFTRREVLEGVSILGLSVAGAGLGTYGAVGRAAAQTGSGQGTIGTEDNPVEAIYVDDLWQNTDNISANAISTGEVNSVVHVKETEKLNDAMARANGSALVVLPEGTTTFTDGIGRPDTTVVVGRGKGVSTLQNDGADWLFLSTDPYPDADVAFSDVTLDMNHIDGAIRPIAFTSGGQRDTVHLHNVEIRNINLASQTTGRGFVFINSDGDPSVNSVEVTGNSVFRYDTVTNRQPYPYKVVEVRGNDSVNNLYVGENVRHIGELWDGDTSYLFHGYRARVRDKGSVNGTFESWDQYPTRLIATGEGSLVEFHGVSRNAGKGDQIRMEADSDGYGTVRLGGSVHYNPDSSSGRNPDRGYIVQTGANDGESPALVMLDDAAAHHARVGCEIRCGWVVTGSFSAIDCGGHGIADSEGRPALQINDKDGRIGSVNIDTNIIVDDSGVDMDPAIDIHENNGRVDDQTHVLEGIARDYTNTQVDDQTDSGSTINTDRLFG